MLLLLLLRRLPLSPLLLPLLGGLLSLLLLLLGSLLSLLLRGLSFRLALLRLLGRLLLLLLGSLLSRLLLGLALLSLLSSLLLTLLALLCLLSRGLLRCRLAVHLVLDSLLLFQLTHLLLCRFVTLSSLRRQGRDSGLPFLGRHILIWRLVLRLIAGVRRLVARLSAGLVLIALNLRRHRNRRTVWLRHRNDLAGLLYLDLLLGRYLGNRLDVHRLKIGCGSRRHDRVLADDYRTAISLLNDSHRNLDCRSSGLDCRCHFPESWNREWIHLWPGPC